jgi:hypothetical protein
MAGTLSMDALRAIAEHIPGEVMRIECGTKDNQTAAFVRFYDWEAAELNLDPDEQDEDGNWHQEIWDLIYVLSEDQKRVVAIYDKHQVIVERNPTPRSEMATVPARKQTPSGPRSRISPLATR